MYQVFSFLKKEPFHIVSLKNNCQFGQTLLSMEDEQK
jgi:hypothetical protein